MKEMKTKTAAWLALCLCGLISFTACSHDDAPTDGKGTVAAQSLQFDFTEEDFGEDEAVTRAMTQKNGTSTTGTADLGDCEAEISVESEPADKTPKAATRAIAGPKHYTIRVYEHTSRAYKGDIRGTFNGSTFTPDPNTEGEVFLQHGYYDFVAYNDKVTLTSADELQVNRADAETAMIGTAENVLIDQDPKQKVSLTMKHIGCRVRMQLVCKKHIPAGVKATFEETAPQAIPGSMVYYIPLKTTTPRFNAPLAAMPQNFPASTQQGYSGSNYGQNYSYTVTATGYCYFLPKTDASKLKLTFTGGAVFWKPLTGTIPQLTAALPEMQPGKSYVIKIKLKPKFRYLFSDGTTGFFQETTMGGGAKTPIGLVVKDNDGTPHSGVAMALHNANNGTRCTWGPTNIQGTNYDNGYPVTYRSGYDLTWNSSFGHNGMILGNRTDFPAFYHAGHYNPGVVVTGTNISKWYLPSGRDYEYLNSRCWGQGTAGKIMGTWSTVYTYVLEEAIKQVNGTEMVSSFAYWISDEGGNIGPVYNVAHFRYMQPQGMYLSYTLKSDQLFVRPFVKF